MMPISTRQGWLLKWGTMFCKYAALMMKNPFEFFQTNYVWFIYGITQ